MKVFDLQKMIASVILAGVITGCSSGAKESSGRAGSNQVRAVKAEHYVVYHEEGSFAAWPANNGIWSWDGKEILVWFTLGSFEEKSGHNIVEPYLSMLSRSTDGGRTWESYDPEGYIGDGNSTSDLEQPVDFLGPGTALRVTGTGYHGNESPRGAYFFSTDRGRSWSGPHPLKGLETVPGLDSLELTPRTDYIVNSDGSCLVFISARIPGVFASDRIFLARTGNGGQSFDFLGWVVGFDDPYRAVMSSSVRCSDKKLLSGIRRREAGTDRCWIDLFVSGDNGLSWNFLSKVGDIGPENGNPPALLRLDDGRLLCAYGQREYQQIIARISDNNGTDWGPEIILRDDYKADSFDNSDLGYARMVQREDGKILTLYYWATEERYEQHIACTVWDPDQLIYPRQKK